MSRTVQLYNLSRALRSQSEYAKRMNFLSASIFGEVRRPTDQKSMKLVTAWSRQPYETRKDLVQYYPAHDEVAQLMRHLRNYGLFRDEHEDFKEEMERLRRFVESRRKIERRKKTIDRNHLEVLFELILKSQLSFVRRKERVICFCFISQPPFRVKYTKIPIAALNLFDSRLP